MKFFASGFLAGSLLASVLFAIGWPSAFSSEGNELSSKREWSILQSAVAANFEKLLTTGTTKTTLLLKPQYQNTEFDIFGVRENDSNKFIWMIGNPTNPPNIKFMTGDQSAKKVRLSQSQFEQIKAAIRLNDDVLRFLQNCVEN